MAISDALFTSVSRLNPTNSNTTDLPPAEQTRMSDFLTVQSLTNFAAMTGAISVAWRALERLSADLFASQWTPFVLALLWLVVSLVASAQADPRHRSSPGFWLSAVFIGFLNSLVLFAAALGIS